MIEGETRKIGQYVITKFEYHTLQGDCVNNLWVESPEGEGMEIKPGDIPSDATVEWMDDFWRDNF